MIWTSLLSVAFGIVWHTILVVLFGGRVSDALSWMILAGGLAGLIAGWSTVRSRQRSQARERVLDALLTYYLAFLVYWLSGLVIKGIVGSVGGSASGPPTDVLLFLRGLLYATFFATILGVVLVPLCVLTRYAVWTFHVWMQPNPPQQPTGAPSGAGG